MLNLHIFISIVHITNFHICIYFLGQEESLARFWSSTVLRLQIHSDEYHIFQGPNATAVLESESLHRKSWGLTSGLGTGFLWKIKDIKLRPFDKSCVGILTKEAYAVQLQIYRVNYWQVRLMMLFTQYLRNTFVYIFLLKDEYNCVSYVLLLHECDEPGNESL